MQNHYQPTTRIGNWYEEMVLEDEKMREFLEKKAAGTLTIQRIRQNLVMVQMPPPQEDGLVHYSTMIRIKNAGLECFLGCDPGDAEHVEEGMYSATGCRTDDVTARNVWVLKQCNNNGAPKETREDDVLCFGDEFLISSSDSLGPNPFYIASHHLDWSHFSRVSRKQLVYSTEKETPQAIWRVESVGRDTMMEMEGEPVHIGEPVLLKNVTTNLPLIVQDATFLNDYGSEHELICGKLADKKGVWTFTDH
ncbi:hypothetical protein TVAG_194820 [Trichomonas vaginalis G3]|uniref:Uncharacterized protein n=1 Tax=Trichomonas vaginalis (strain ATCC PRA-98 / G3) TaxID=412133 RepID=A2FL25_TRIV3|nr:cilia- and flagella-associated protein 161 family [Trichomonas vaginalis G3]EAX94396.1 hypothetical protein TVAG_194820 [Trichomonas vaginalis G3]KAI5493990.1 cilia- and flagella-associated protein 161 family [Trichomonas vaginalis G3]|eukprot:XP_001307326.1 hypothetical protein [Trichomonas vaginalis G3]